MSLRLPFENLPLGPANVSFPPILSLDDSEACKATTCHSTNNSSLNLAHVPGTGKLFLFSIQQRVLDQSSHSLETSSKSIAIRHIGASPALGSRECRHQWSTLVHFGGRVAYSCITISLSTQHSPTIRLTHILHWWWIKMRLVDLTVTVSTSLPTGLVKLMGRSRSRSVSLVGRCF